jgi:hypothetical protein
MAKQKQQQVTPEDFTPEEQQQMQRYGQAMTHPPSDFDEEVEKELAKHYPHEGEANARKMHAVHRGEDLGPTEFQEQQQKQTGALQQLSGSAGQQKAAQAQAGMTTPAPPPAPSGPAGVTRPYEAQASPGAVPTSGEMPKQQGDQEQAPPEQEPG